MGSTTAGMMREAYGRHRAGDLSAAIALYERVLTAEPENPDALHLRGVAALQSGNSGQAETYLGRAAALRPHDPDFLQNYATALMENGRFDSAIPHYRKADSQRPNHPETLYNLANCLARAGQAKEAIPYYERLLAGTPGHLPTVMALGLARMLAGDTERGLTDLEKAADGAPDAREPALNYASALFEHDRLAEADARTAELRRRFPDDPEVRNLSGLIAAANGDLAAAEEHYRRALTVAPDMAELRINIGHLARDRGDIEAAVASYRKALEISPRLAAAHTNLGNGLFALGRHDDAFRHYRTAVEIDPGYATGWSNLGVALRAVGDPDGARAALDRALDVEPDHPDARMGRAIVELLRGNFSTGWRDYLGRNSVRGRADRLHRERLPGDLAGKSLIVEADQGLGDELFFLRFAPGLRDRGADVSYRSSPRIADMVRRAGIVDRVLDGDAPAEGLTVSVGDLPYLAGMADGDAPPPPFAIPPLAELEGTMRARLEACGPPPWIAVTWRAGTPDRDRLLFKAAPAERIADAAGSLAGTLIAVQRGPAKGETAALANRIGRPLHDLTAFNADLESMLALMGLIDVYICVSNTNVHLRAARGRPSHVLIPFPPEFRWMESGAESPWFPDTCVYRQTADGDWERAFGELSAALARERA